LITYNDILVKALDNVIYIRYSVIIMSVIINSVIKRSNKVVNEVHDFRMTWKIPRFLSLTTLNISCVVKSRVESSYQLMLERYHFVKW